AYLGAGEVAEGEAMTEAEWLACKDLQPMREFLRGKVSERKLRLFLCACCRSLWDQLIQEWSRTAVEVVEWHIDGAATDTLPWAPTPRPPEPCDPAVA